MNTLLKQLPRYSAQLNRKLQCIHFIYVKYRKLRDEITNKQIEYILANQGILTGELQPNPQAYFREYTTILKQVGMAEALVGQNQVTIEQCLELVSQIYEKLGNEDVEDDITETMMQSDPMEIDSNVEESFKGVSEESSYSDGEEYKENGRRRVKVKGCYMKKISKKKKGKK